MPSLRRDRRSPPADPAHRCRLRRGASADFIARRVGEDMEQLHLSWDAVADVSTIDIKKDEVGITEFARARHLPVRYYTARQLNDARENLFRQALCGASSVRITSANGLPSYPAMAAGCCWKNRAATA